MSMSSRRLVDQGSTTRIDWRQWVQRVPYEINSQRGITALRNLQLAWDARERRDRLGVGDHPIAWKVRSTVLATYLTEGGNLSDLCDDDDACMINLWVGCTWPQVLDVLSRGKHTMASAVYVTWGDRDWMKIEEAIAGKEPVTRSLATEFGVSRTALESLYRLHGVEPGR